MSAVAEEMAKREQALQVLSEKVKADISTIVQRSVKALQKKTAKRYEG